jgi:hypothetical protein
VCVVLFVVLLFIRFSPENEYNTNIIRNARNITHKNKFMSLAFIVGYGLGYFSRDKFRFINVCVYIRTIIK